ncbi:MAG: hypothetical protein LBI87_06710 [Candidatus Accumulibacter sp.]|jgi:hypothetical protein|nr:hypothetical protein [Accumulibacter sp.]
MEMNHFCLDVLQRITVPDFLDYMRSVFPYLYAMDADNSHMADLHIPDQAYMVMHEHVVHNRFPNLVGGFTAEIKPKLDRLVKIAQKERFYKTPVIDNPSGELVVEQTPIDVKAGDNFQITASLFNQGKETWHGYGSNPVLVSYHWQLPDGSEYLILGGVRTQLSASLIHAGESVQTVIEVQAPDRKGRFRLILTLVQEGVCWFEDRGFKPAIREIEIV